jgi:hypothetical protein
MPTSRQFYVADKGSADRATKSNLDQKPIEISGTIGGRVEFYRGVVQSVAEDRVTRRWRITILDEK